MINDCVRWNLKSILYDSQFMMQDALIIKHKDPEAQCEENTTSLYDLLSSKNK